MASPKKVKNVVIVRKDLKLKKGKLFSIASATMMKFITDNNESGRSDTLQVKLSNQEVEWIQDSAGCEILVTDSLNSLEHIGLLAELQGINVYYTFKSIMNENSELLCIALGPDDEDIIDHVVGNLKTL